MTNYAFCRCNERSSIWERIHPFIFFFSSSSSSFSSSFFSSSYRGKSSLLLPRYSFFRASTCTYARITSGASRFWKRKWRHGPFWPAKEKRCDRMHRYDLLYCQAAVALVAPVELIYEVLANFRLKKQKKKKESIISPFSPLLQHLRIYRTSRDF